MRYQGVTPRPGDIMLVRSGYVRWHEYVLPIFPQLYSSIRSTSMCDPDRHHTIPYIHLICSSSFANPEERKRGTQQNSVAIGLANNEATVRWLYDHHFAAVGGDTVAFEAWPPPLETGWTLHEWLLVQWGTPIGEMWNLEALSKVCEKHDRWSFFLTSAPLNVKGGVGSPPGAIAIF